MATHSSRYTTVDSGQTHNPHRKPLVRRSRQTCGSLKLALIAGRDRCVSAGARRGNSGACRYPTGLMTLTVNELRRLFDALLLSTHHTITSLLAWSRHAGDDKTNTEPANPTTDAEKHNDHDLRLQY